MSRVARSVSRAGPGDGKSRGSYKIKVSRTYARRVVVKARVVRTMASSPKALAEHLRYISRDSAVRSEDQGKIFDAHADDVDRDTFADAAKDDRHHFRLIVSPEDGTEMADLKPFVRDLVSQMEQDLQTRLKWVGAVHDNTDHPHAHIVIQGKRDDGRDLVMPRRYIAHQIRERAEELVTLELGPESQLERDVKHARRTGVERLTSIDRSLARMSNEDGVLNLDAAPARYRSVNIARLRKLKSLGLAQEMGRQKWRLSDGFETTLKEMGLRRDMIKQMHRALYGREGRTVDAARPFSGSAGQVPITGAVLRKGMGGEGHDEPYLIVDGIDGRVTTSAISTAEDLKGIVPGMIVTLSPPDTEPRKSDITIASIASANEGIYSAALHQQSDPRATSEFVRAHVRRLEAMRRNGIAERNKDGTWNIPANYLASVCRHQERYANRAGANIQVESWGNVSAQVEAHGLTWLDTAPKANDPAYGFGQEIKEAMDKRSSVLQQRGIVDGAQSHLTRKHIAALKRLGLSHHGDVLTKKFGKDFRPLPRSGVVEGVYIESIVTPEGKFAVIDRGKTFTLAPWRKVMDRARGQAIAGAIRGDHISWQIGKKRGLGK
tara:strand:- start:3072 stop:4889 length:1818 start_codon:yes stop_codon:yes gene_type:complete